MEYLVWAWRVLLGRISITDVPEPIQSTVKKIVETFVNRKTK